VTGMKRLHRMLQNREKGYEARQTMSVNVEQVKAKLTCADSSEVDGDDGGNSSEVDGDDNNRRGNGATRASQPQREKRDQKDGE
jgi:hypothetical protein